MDLALISASESVSLCSIEDPGRHRALDLNSLSNYSTCDVPLARSRRLTRL
jgi:hypothetical protein